MPHLLVLPKHERSTARTLLEVEHPAKDAANKSDGGPSVEASHVAADLEKVILTEEQILARVGALAADLHDQFLSRTPVLVGVLGGAATFTVDLARAYP